jgi:hypothetical protein
MRPAIAGATTLLIASSKMSEKSAIAVSFRTYEFIILYRRVRVFPHTTSPVCSSAALVTLGSCGMLA